MKLRFGRIVLLMALLLPFHAAAQEGAPLGSKEVEVDRIAVKDWTFVCVTASATEKKRCRINAKIWADAEKKAMTAAVVLLKSESSGNSVMMLRSGTGLDKARKVRVRVDDGTVYGLPPGECGETECRTVFTVPEQLLADMKKGTKILFIVPVGDADQFVELPFSLLGFTRAHGLLLAS